jgi:signal peptidase I
MSEPIPSSSAAPVETPSAVVLSGSDAYWVQAVRSWVRDLVLALFIAGVIILFFYQPVKVEGTSMMPRLTDQERIFINKFVYRLEPIHRGDVVVFRFPRDPSKSYIKRIIGLPGDTVAMVDGQVLVNGKRVEEPYVLPEFRGRQTALPRKVDEGEFYVLGDHRTSSNDSRAWGTVPREYIYGKAELVYWPLGRWGLLE